MTATKAIEMSLYKTARKDQWGKRHALAWRAPNAIEEPIVNLYTALAQYADRHHARYESPIGEDGVLGVEWLTIAKALRGLLNGELGRLDGGTLDSLIYALVESAGFEPAELEK